MSFISELRRRKVVPTLVVYSALGWVGIEVVSTIGQVYAWPDWLVRSLVGLIILGLPIAITVSWMFDLTIKGFRLESTDTGEMEDASAPRPRGSGPDPLAPISRPPPAPATPLLGRDEALRSAVDRLRSGVRVLTVTGLGGTGKTRFSIELFRQVEADYPDGSAFVSVASVEASEDVMPTVGVALDIPEAPGRSALDAAVTVIGDRHILLMLDNLEQVLAVAGDVAELVSRCPNLQVIATSRAPLKIGAEAELFLPPLELPPEDGVAPEDLTLYPAVELFVQRASKVKPDFQVGAENGSDVAAICRRLDGLPLALELAAARIRILEPHALLERLDHALDVLTSGDRDLPERQRTLRATVDWSYSLLDPSEQCLLRRASVFREGWTYDAMEAVCYDENGRHRALDDLDSLVEKGLVQVAEAGGRYLLLETIHEFASESLEESGEVADVRLVHADFFLDFSESVNAGIKGRGQLEWMRRAGSDNGNTLSALQWLTGQARVGDEQALEKALLMCGYLNWFWHIGGQHLTARGTVDELLALAEGHPPTLGRALALLAGGMVSMHTGEMERALIEFSGAFADAHAIGDEAAMAEADLVVGFIHLMEGRMSEARAALQDCVERSGEIGEDFTHALGMGILGMLHGVTGDFDGGFALIDKARAIQIRIEDYEGGGVTLSCLAQLRFAKGEGALALEHYHEALESFETVGDRPEIARVHGEMGWVALSMNRVPDARLSFVNSLRAYDEVGSPRGVGLALMGLAAAEASDGEANRAVMIAAAAEVMAGQVGVVVEHPMGPGAGDQIEALRANFPGDVLESLTEAGRSLSPSEVLAMVAKPAASALTTA